MVSHAALASVQLPHILLQEAQHSTPQHDLSVPPQRGLLCRAAARAHGNCDLHIIVVAALREWGVRSSCVNDSNTSSCDLHIVVVATLWELGMRSSCAYQHPIQFCKPSQTT